MNTPKQWLAGLIGLIVTACVASWGINQHDARVRSEAQFADSTRKLAVHTAFLEQQKTDAESRIHASAETVTVRRIAYRTLRDTLMLAPKTAADTALAVAELPVFVHRSDDALHADSVHQAEATTLQHISDSLIVSLKDERDTWRNAKVQRLPRFGAYVEPLYDPVGKHLAGDLGASMRLAGAVSLTARVTKRFVPGDTARVYVGGRITF